MTQEVQAQADAKPLLTIAIPTYNRVRYLRELLSCLFDQLIDEPRVELIVSDNASPDETPQLVEEFQQRGLKIRSIRNETNIGADANFLQCFEQARGKYVWIIGDDDVVVPGALAAVLMHLQTKNYDLVYLDSFPLQESSNPSFLSDISNASEIEDARLFVSRVHVFLTFISGNIINKETVLSQGSRSFSHLIDSNLIQLGWTYLALNGYRRGLHITDKLVGARVNNTGGYKLLQVFGPNIVRVTEEWLNSRDLRSIIYNGTLQRFWPGMLLEYKLIAKSFSDEASPDDILGSVFRHNLRYWLFVYPVLALPYRLAACWLLLDRVVNRADRAFNFILLRLG